MTSPLVFTLVILIVAVVLLLSERLRADLVALLVVVALGIAGILTPLGHPVNVLVMGPGGYRFRDYLKVGWPLTLLIFGVVLVLLPVFWPLTQK